MLHPEVPVPISVFPLAYHFHFSTCGAQLLVSEQHGVTLVPPGLRGETEKGEETVGHIGQQRCRKAVEG